MDMSLLAICKRDDEHGGRKDADGLNIIAREDNATSMKAS